MNLPVLHAVLREPVAFATTLLVVVTAGLWLCTFLLWRSTAKLAKDSKEGSEAQVEKLERSAAAMERVAGSMEINAAQVVRSVDMQRQFGKMQLRPYLTVLVGKGIYQDDTHIFEIQPRVINTGHTPAQDVRWRIAVEPVEIMEMDKFRFPLPKETVGRNTVSPHQEYNLSAALPGRIDDPSEVQALFLGNGEKVLTVYGFISYRDGFKRRYFTTFAQLVWWIVSKDADGKITGAQLVGRFLSKHNRAS